MSEKKKSVFVWVGRVCLLVMAIAAFFAGANIMPPEGAQISGVVAGVAGIVARWIEQYLPAVRGDAAKPEGDK